MTRKKENESGPSLIAGGILLAISLLLVFWRGPGLVEDIELFTGGDTTMATMYRKIGNKTRQGKRTRFLYYFTVEDDTIRDESRMFEPLMYLTDSSDNMGGDSYFKVVYDPTTPELHYPRATLRIAFFFSLFMFLLAIVLARHGISAIITAIRT